jgi:stearoyl-CoA desaturase (Delta-9 desaturase)
MHLLLGVLVGLAVTQVALVATSVYLHRGLAHGALHAHPALAMVCRVFLWISTGMKPREWAAVHRRHHQKTDTPDDPHSPICLGFWRVQLANAALYRRSARDGVTVEYYARDLPPDRLDRWLFDRAWLGLGVGVTVLCLVLGWQTGLLASVVHMVGYLGLSGAVNAVGHTWGRRPYGNSATNSQLLALVTAGEGFHNNHHERPTSAQFSGRRGEIDFGWWTVRLLAMVRLVRIRPLSARTSS